MSRAASPPNRATRKAAQLLAVLLLVAVVPTLAHAATTWTGATSTDWFDAGNWSGGVPITTTDASIDTLTNATTITSAGAVDRYTYIGNTATGALTISGGGTLASSNISYIGRNAGSVGTAIVTGAGSSWTSALDLHVGNLGNGTLTISDQGTVTNMFGSIGDSVGSVGIVTVEGFATWNNSTYLYVGGSGNGTLTISNGGIVNSVNATRVGAGSGGIGWLTVTGTGSTLSSANGITVGEYGTGYLNVLNGGSVISVGGGIGGVGAASSGTAVVSGIGSTWTMTGGLSISYAGVGNLTISDGGSVSDTSGSISYQVGSTGAVTVTDTGSQWINSSDLFVGGGGTGTLIVSNGGIVSNTVGYIGGNSTASGWVTISGTGTTWTNSSSLSVGRFGDGHLVIENGGTVTNISGFIGNYAGSLGNAYVTGAGSRWANANTLSVGNYGTGILTVSDSGSVSSVGALYVGTYTGSSGTLTISNAGRVTSTGSSYIGYNAGSVGTATVTGDNSLWSTSSNFYVGNSGTGTLTVSDGGAVSSVGALYVGTNTGSSGTLTISNAGRVTSTGSSFIGYNFGAVGTATVEGVGSSWVSASNFYVGDSGSATLTISDSGLVSSVATMYIGKNSGSTGTLIIGSASGSTAVAAGTISTPTISFGAGTGTLLFNHTATNYVLSSNITGAGSIVALSGVTSLTGNLSAFTGTTSVSAAAQLFLTGTYGGSIDVSSGGDASLDSAIGGSVTVSDATSSISGAIAGDLTLSGTSTAYLTSSGTIGGDVTIGDGSVFSDNGTVSGDVTVNDGGTLKGNGTVSGDADINDGATLAPGNSIGTLNVVGDVNFASGSTYQVEVNASGASDQTIATGAANIAGGTVSILPESGGLYGVNTTYTFLTAGSISGTFDDVTLTTSALFLDAALSYDATHAYATLTRNSTAFASVAATPNQSAVAEALDSMPVNDLYNAIAGQSSLTNTQAAFRSLTGELHADIKGSLLEGDSGFAQTLIARQDVGVTAARNLWAQAYGDWSERNGDHSNTFAFNHKEHGLAFGYDAPLASLKDSRLGIAFAYGRSRYGLTTDAANSASGNADHYRLSAYGQKQVGNVFLRGSGNYGLHQIETDRTAIFTGYSDRLRAEYHAQSLGGTMEAAYKLIPVPEVQLEPYARLNYGMVQLSRFEEQGGNAVLTADSDLAAQGQTTFGLRAQQALKFFEGQAACNDTILNPCGLLKAQLGWRHMIGGAASTGSYSFTSSQPFTTTSAEAARNALEMNIGLDITLTDQATLDLTYAGTHAPQSSSNAVRGGVSWRW